MIALVSAKGSPGVTTTALAMTLAAPGRCLLAECDPAGGDILAGYLQGLLPAERGLAQLAVAELRGRLRDEFDSQLVDLDAPHRRRMLLPGVTDPAQSATVASVWPSIAEHLRHWPEAGADPAGRVITDCGRLSDSHFPAELLRRADQVLLVVRGTLPSVSAAVPALRVLGEQLAEPARLGLLVIEVGPYRASEVANRLDAELVATLPEDTRTASRLSFGGTVHLRMPLLRAAIRVHGKLTGSAPAELPEQLALPPAPADMSQEVAGV